MGDSRAPGRSAGPGADATPSLLLLERARAGDHAALNDLVQRYLPRMRCWASGRLAPAARGLLDTGDIVQETIVKAIRNLDRIDVRREGAFQAYLREALRNKLFDAYRGIAGKDPAGALESNLPSPGPSPLQIAIGEDVLAQYDAALQRLKPEDREAVILRVELCYEYAEIAALLGKSSAAAARVAVSRALARLAREME
jgi:RNA polymerase sigma-70 factor (ECF subfamily)